MMGWPYQHQIELTPNPCTGTVDYRRVKALAACYELQEYVAGIVGK